MITVRGSSSTNSRGGVTTGSGGGGGGGRSKGNKVEYCMLVTSAIHRNAQYLLNRLLKLVHLPLSVTPVSGSDAIPTPSFLIAPLTAWTTTVYVVPGTSPSITTPIVPSFVFIWSADN